MPEKRVRFSVSWACLLIAVACASQALPSRAQQTSVDESEPHSRGEDSGAGLLSFDELIALSATASPQGELGARLEHLLTTPVVHNFPPGTTDGEAIQPHRPVSFSGPLLRVALWNIERGLNFDQIEAALAGPSEFERIAQMRSGLSPRQKHRIDDQLAELKDADVIILNEVDLGMKRTEYRDVAHDLAAALHMNYAYGVEFVEVDPLLDLDTESVHLPDSANDARLQKDLQVDRERFRGLHGSAILSRYPIHDARILRLPVCHDWYGAEVKEIANLEKAKRWSAHKLFGERIEREVRHGGRMALIANIDVPGLPDEKATIVAAHLENKCPPACRRRQMDTLLADLKQESGTVILAGDLNTTSKDNTPTSIRNEIMNRVTDYRFWINQAVSRFNPLGVYQYALVPLRYFHGYQDPTAFHVPVFWENRERGLFKDVKRFRFDDGGAFDFSGIAGHATNGRTGTLADSNERAWKGFVPTYSFTRDFGGLAGNFKLDWFFVKPARRQSGSTGQNTSQNQLFAPEFGMTMRELNSSVPDRISDHPPLVVDLPLGNANPPPTGQQKSQR